MGLPSWLGGKPKKPTSPAPLAEAPGAPKLPGTNLLAPPPSPPNLVGTMGGFAATNAARRTRATATAGAGRTAATMAPSTTKATPKKLFAAGRTAAGLY